MRQRQLRDPRTVDAWKYSPGHIPSAASQNARFGVSFAYNSPDGTTQPSAKEVASKLPSRF
jgi:hypothetical protein